MAIVNGRTYRFINVYHDGYGLNIYGTKDTDIKGGQNVCLYSESSTDQMQQWKIEERGSNGYRLHAVLKPSYVLGCSDGSISTSYKNNAHMYMHDETDADDVDCAVEFEYVGSNQVRIHLGQKGLCLTATTVAENDAELSNNISTSAALRGGKEGRGNVYWKTPADEGSMTWKKQCWEVVEVGGGTVPDPDPEAQMTLAQLKNKFPAGKYWNHVGMSGNNQDSYTSSPCPTHANGNIDTCNAFELNGAEYAWQCMGFAEKCGYDFSGTNPRVNGEWTTYESASALDNLKPGDIVRYFTDRANDVRHSIFVTGVSGNTVTFGDCNADNKCGIRWNATISKQVLRSQFVHLRSAPFTLA